MTRFRSRSDRVSGHRRCAGRVGTRITDYRLGWKFAGSLLAAAKTGTFRWSAFSSGGYPGAPAFTAATSYAGSVIFITFRVRRALAVLSTRRRTPQRAARRPPSVSPTHEVASPKRGECHTSGGMHGHHGASGTPTRQPVQSAEFLAIPNRLPRSMYGAVG